MIRKRRGLSIALSLLLMATMIAVTLLSSGCNNNKTGWDKVSQKGVITVGVETTFPPLAFNNESKKLVGFDIDLAIMAAAILGLKVKFKKMPWKEKESALYDKKIDIIWSGMSKTPDREKQFLFSDIYLDATNVAVVKKDSNIISMINSGVENIGVLESSNQHEWLKINNARKISVHISQNQKKLIDDELINGVVDAVITDNAFALFYVKHYDKDGKVRIIDEGLGSHGYAVGLRKGDEVLAEKINGAIKEIVESGRMDTLKTKWFGDHESLPTRLSVII